MYVFGWWFDMNLIFHSWEDNPIDELSFQMFVCQVGAKVIGRQMHAEIVESQPCWFTFCTRNTLVNEHKFGI